MPNPIDAPEFVYHLDPDDEQEFYPIITRGYLDGDWLRPEDRITRFTVKLPIEAVAAGLDIVEDDFRQTRMAADVIAVTFGVLLARRKDAAFDGEGKKLPTEIEVFYFTGDGRKESKQRTGVVVVRNR